MATLNVNIISGGLSRQSTDTDTWGGLFCEVDAMPSGWTANEVKIIYKPEDLEDYGIEEDSTDDYYKLVYWHVSELFRINSDATLYLQLGLTENIAPSDVLTAFANKEDRLRLFGYVSYTTLLSTTAAETMQSALESMFSTYMQPARCVCSFMKAADDSLPDFSAASNTRVMIDISNDITEDGLAETIFAGIGMCGGAGTIVGQLLGLGVHQKPSWRSYPVNGDGNWELLGDINGDSVEALTQTNLDTYDDQGLTLVARTPRLTDAYLSNSRMACDTSNDYAIITHGRVIDKAIVMAYDGLVESLDGPVYVDTDTGEINAETIQLLTRKAYNKINNNMVVGRTGNAVEVSVDAATGSLDTDSVYIDPDQDVLSTETVEVEIRIVPVGASKTITVNIGLTVPS